MVIPSLSGIGDPGPLSGIIDFGATPWAAGTELYILWADDNGPSNNTAPQKEGAYTIDNLTISADIIMGIRLNLVIPAPLKITAQPVGTNMFEGGILKLTVGYEGSMATFQWYKDGAPVSGANSATYSVNPATTNLTGNYYVVLTNASSAVTSAVVRVTVTWPVTAGDDGPYAIENDQPASWDFFQWLANDSAGPQGQLAVARVTAVSTNGATLVAHESGVVYLPAPGYTGEDAFTYTVSDGQGREATATVRLWIVAGAIPPANRMNITATPGKVRVRFQGTPGRTYRLQRAERIDGPWEAVLTLECPAHRLIDYLDQAPLPAAGFYRVVSETGGN